MKSNPPNDDAAPNASQKRARPGKSRIDVLIVERGLAPSREKAQAMLLAGNILVHGQKIEKPGAQIASDSQIEIIGETLRFASRGGLKLEGALEDFGASPQGKVCLDVGSSTGGFTDCLLQQGALRVYAVDVSADQLDWKLRKDPRVVAIERNARYLRAQELPERASLVTMDVSFISVTKVLPAIVPLAVGGADFLILIKPQFELEKREVGKGGIVRDNLLHQKAIERVTAAAAELSLDILGVRASHLTGAEGNQEFFLHARVRG
ncbi:MAG TPA: TlyA family RNA methyltransferase [Candidatus Binatus sp.]|jgi:23S rRNA (cytidine1920-2'-O)/16S rRNA (cytidine1409-2'-O)-methyltransferase|nr:TlyA family RNA methyltransferase [Candidatus Binatus sp.]